MYLLDCQRRSFHSLPSPRKSSFKRLDGAIYIEPSLLVFGPPALLIPVGDLAGSLRNRFSVWTRDDDNAVAIGHDDVAGKDAHAPARDRHVVRVPL